MHHDLATVSFVIGAVVALAVARLTGRLLDRLAPWARITAPKAIPQEDWNRVVAWKSEATAVIGLLETLLCYLAVALADDQSAFVAIAGWLTFKVASKWEVQSNVIKVPEILAVNGVDPLEWLRTRREWGWTLYERFLVGTLLNVLVGIAIASIVRYLTKGAL